MKVSKIGFQVVVDADGAVRSIEHTGKAFKKLKGDAQSAGGQGVDKLGASLEQLEGRLNRVSQTAKRTIAVATGTLTAMTATFASFEKNITNVGNILDRERSQMDGWAKTIMGLNSNLGEADDLTNALYQTMSSGIAEEGALDVMVTSAKAARGNLASLFETVDAGTSVLNAYSLEATEIITVLDAMTKTVDLGKLRFDEMASNIGKGISIAASAGVSYQELFSTLATLTLNGLSVEEAMTAVRNILIVGLKPSEQVKDAMHDLGVDMGAAALKAKGLGGWMADAAAAIDRAAASGVDVSEATAMLFPNIRALNGAAKLASEQGLAKYNDTLEQIINSSGKVEDNFRRMSSTTSAEVKTTVAELKKLGIEFGALANEEILPLIINVRELISDLRGLDDGTKRQILSVIKFSAMLGGAALALGAVVKAVKVMNSAMLAMTGTSSLTAALNQASLAATARFSPAMTSATLQAQGLNAATAKTATAISRMGTVAAGLGAFWIGWELGKLIDELLGVSDKLNDVFGHLDIDGSAQGAIEDMYDTLRSSSERAEQELEGHWDRLERFALKYGHTAAQAFNFDINDRSEEGLRTMATAIVDLKEAVSAVGAAQANRATATRKATEEDKKAAAAAKKLNAEARAEAEKAAQKALQHQATLEDQQLTKRLREATKQWEADMKALDEVTESMADSFTELLHVMDFPDAPIGLLNINGLLVTAEELTLRAKEQAIEYRDVLMAFQQLQASTFRGLGDAIFGAIMGREDDIIRAFQRMGEDMASAMSDAFSAGFLNTFSSPEMIQGEDGQWTETGRRIFTGFQSADFSQIGDAISESIAADPMSFIIGGASMGAQGIQQQDPLMAALGGAGMGAGLWTALSIGTAGWGAAIGAAVMGIASLFSGGSDDPHIKYNYNQGGFYVSGSGGEGMNFGDEQRRLWEAEMDSLVENMRMSFRRAAQAFGDPSLLEGIDSSLVGILSGVTTRFEGTVDDLTRILGEDKIPEAFDEIFNEVFRGWVPGAGQQHLGVLRPPTCSTSSPTFPAATGWTP
jgi:TP901 family phage tail tape measure protein